MGRTERKDENGYSMTFNEEDLLITDPCYFIKDEQWLGMCSCLHDPNKAKEYLEKLGIKGFAVGTLYGDWSCTTYKVCEEEALDLIDTGEYPEWLHDDHEELGKFCADSGTVCVVSLDDVLNYDDKAAAKLLDKSKYHVATVVRDFTGIVTVFDSMSEGSRNRHIIGLPYRFPLNGESMGDYFITAQTGL